MKMLTQEDLIPNLDYERQREEFRSRIIELKKRRRISVGPLITLVFENRDTLQFQIQEMIRVERIIDPVKVRDELDVYNALLPMLGELSATLLIEIVDQESVKRWLDLFMGLDHGQKVAIRAGQESVYGEFERGHSHETKISAVHFVRFRPSAALIATLGRREVPVTLSIDHATYHEATVVPWEMRQEWLIDLEGK
ncbi:MAG TPA: DUF3501 family protein [Nitrospiraceae bacterium]|nr:DUF3501 family protein [Nitrospiraceae bacterium]